MEGPRLRILLNATDAVLNTRALQRYVVELARGLPCQEEGDEVDLLFLTHRYLRVRRFLATLPEGARFRCQGQWWPRRRLRERYERSPRRLEKLIDGIDVYHETTFDSPPFTDIPVVTTPKCSPGLAGNPLRIPSMAYRTTQPAMTE